jgi:ketosteroid isomerase-like protein
MALDNVAFVKELYEAFGRGEIDRLVAACAPGVRWHVKGRPSDFPMIGAWTGPEGVRDFFRKLDEIEQAGTFEPREFHAAGEMVFVIGRYSWTVRKTGKAVECEWVHIFKLEDGKVAEFREFTDTAQFAAAAR